MKMARPLMLAGLSALLVWFIAQTLAVNTARRELDQTLLLTTRAVEAEVERLRALPAVVGEDARIRDALAGDGPLQDANTYLEAVAAHVGAEELFLINAEGDTIAASNWNTDGSYIGQNYAFRPYFQDAITEGQGQFYAIGVTTGIPGYFLAARVEVGGAEGVVAVKQDLSILQDTWRAAEADIALADEHGVVFLSARPDWQYRPLVNLTPDALAQLVTTRAYEGVGLGETAPLLTEPPVGGDARGRNWIARIGAVPATGGQVVAIRPLGALQLMAFGWAVLAALAALAVAATVKALEQRRQITALRLSQSEKMEAMVVARTADLAREVDARRQAEADLRATQEALIHAEKMAAMGRMSAAIVHEISQPLAAMEATLSAAEMGMKPPDAATVTRIGKARDMIRRMQRTTKHLKSFARKENAELSLIDLRTPLKSALDLVLPRAKVVGVTPDIQVPEGKVPVMAGAVRVEQVIANLLLNALDAIEAKPDSSVTVTLTTEGDQALIEVCDTGVGISEQDLPRVTDPFFSTKLTGEGLGLGLAICKAILTDFRGTLDIWSAPEQGTRVTIALPIGEKKEETR
ncbi:two-component system C4-dicarboxylate transport sensor histidine kinase DctB [Tritonibacter scottomollicae]|uniref:histidine kinase n=2 Tax=Tritonibacter scottomollicae TaxID=483013 RepID=A0A2T1AGQ3_TRISK|nr:two-component system C4-dicarboxylate transport sensor histidine kinase DctB [Tritonibacter scottomollicae]